MVDRNYKNEGGGKKFKVFFDVVRKRDKDQVDIIIIIVIIYHRKSINHVKTGLGII